MRIHLRTKLILLLLFVLVTAVAVWAWQADRLTNGLYQLIEASKQDDHQRLLFAELGRKQADAELLALLFSRDVDRFDSEQLEPVLLDRQVLWTGVRLPEGRWVQWPEPYPPEILEHFHSQHAPQPGRLQFPVLHCDGMRCDMLYRFRVPCGKSKKEPCELYIQQVLDVFLADYYTLTDSDILMRITTDQGIQVVGTHLSSYPTLVKQLRENALALAPGTGQLWQGDQKGAAWLLQRMQVPPAWQQVSVYVVSDVRALTGFFNKLRWEILVGLLGLGLLIFAALYVGLNRLVSQLEVLEHAMAAVAKQQFDKAVQALKGLKRSRFQDELDELIDETLLTTEALQRLSERLSHIAYHDELTGLKNRRTFSDELPRLLQQPGLLVMSDLDRFKQINDLYGHEAGDLALKAFASRLQQFADQRPGTQTYRLAGDEFVLWLPYEAGETLPSLFEGLKKVLDGTFNGPNGEWIYLEASLGAVRVPDDARDATTVMRKADKALYIAKSEDTSRGWHVFDPLADDDTEAVLHEHAVLDYVRDAQAKDAFLLVYQPIMAIQTKKVSHYEVLLRLDDSQGKPISPAEFIPIAERHGLSGRIDEWVFRQVVLKLRHTPEQVQLAVNFSAATIQRRDLAQWVLEQLREKGVPPQRLLVELTETAYVTNMRQARENLEALQNAGVRIALDDFGVGHASFNYMTQLPLDIVKLDGSYVRDMVTNRRHQALVEGITRIVHAWGIQVVAEYVEDGAILALLSAANVDFAQGYFIGKPEKDVLPDDLDQVS